MKRWASLMAQWQRICLLCKRDEFNTWVRKLPWRRKWNPLQYSCLENSVDRGTWRATVHGGGKS